MDVGPLYQKELERIARLLLERRNERFYAQVTQPSWDDAMKEAAVLIPPDSPAGIYQGDLRETT